jgi:hypothetical protein
MVEDIDYCETDNQFTYDQIKHFFDVTHCIPVNRLHCENSIFGDKLTNVAFRAWHDYAHLAMNAPFDAEGERRAAWFQCLQVNNRYLQGHISHAEKERFCTIIDNEVNGQVEYYLAHGCFPNGYQFAKERGL